jgi:transposase
MGNISVHKNTRVKELIEATGATIKFLPPYSPDLNPIEKLWSKLKHNLRRMETSTRDIFDNSISIVSSNDRRVPIVNVPKKWIINKDFS